MADEQKGGENSYLILGGCGFIGRNLVKHLVDNNLASAIRVADKTQPIVAGMNEAHAAAFKNAIVEFKQADLTKPDHVSRAFDGITPDYVVNLCGETRFGMNPEEYQSKCTDTAAKCAAAALGAGCVQKWIEVSTAQVYTGDKKLSNEESKTGPWTNVAEARLAAEEAVKAVNGLPVVVLRPAYVYGSGDKSSLTPRICCAAHYKNEGSKMKFLWSKDLKLNTVHVEDVCRAIVACCDGAAAGSVFNLADKTNLDQGTINGYLGNIFQIQTGFHGALVSKAAKAMLGRVSQEANDNHVPGWTKLCQAHQINNCPISPYIDKELLKDNHLHIDGSAIEGAIGFQYTKPQCTEALVREMIEEFIANKQFPPIL